MDELEIAKRIAAIEGSDIFEVMSCDRNALPLFNPLENQAMCFQLMVKHKVYIDYFGENARAAISFDSEVGEFDVDVLDISMEKAICLVIIAANSKGL